MRLETGGDFNLEITHEEKEVEDTYFFTMLTHEKRTNILLGK
jgi:hypothetical protein